MKFKERQDLELFLKEIGKPELITEDISYEGYKVSAELEELFLKKRKSLISSLKDFRRSQAAKASWRRNRKKYMDSIGTFHKSTQGKAFHRSMARFLATRIFDRGSAGFVESFSKNNEYLKGLTSLRSHIYIENLYYKPISEYVDFLDLSERVVESSINVEKNLLRLETNFNEEDIENLIMCTNPASLKHWICEINNIDSKTYDGVYKACEESNLSFYEIISLIIKE